MPVSTLLSVLFAIADCPGIAPTQKSFILSGAEATTLTRLGQIAVLSSDDDSDWALISVDWTASILLKQSVRHSKYSGRLIRQKPESRHVVACMRQGEVSGILSGSSSFMRLRFDGGFQEVWPVRLEGVISESCL